MRILLPAVAILAAVPVSLNADSRFLSYELPSIVKNIAQGANNSERGKVAKQELGDFTLGVVNNQVNLLEEAVIGGSRFTYLDFSIGSDIFGLDTGSDTKTELMAVYGLYEDENLFLFNQGSVVNFDGRNTYNLGFGARRISDDETVIVGANAFYDYEASSGHKRSSLGVELMTSILEFRANKYNAITGAITYNGIEEAALDGQDFKLTANLPYFYSSNIHFTSSEWKDGEGYKTETEQLGISAEVFPNVVFDVSRQKKDNTASDTVASISYSIPLGATPQVEKKMQDGKWSTKMKPIREKLYQPVQRENRIMKKAIKLGVTVSGY
jgi:hypothetical protein